MQRYVQHGKEGLVSVDDRLDAAGGIEHQLGDCLAQSSFVLRGCEDGDVEDLAWDA